MMSVPRMNVSVQHAPGFGIGAPGSASGKSVAFGSHGEKSGAPRATIAQNTTRAVPAMPTMLSRSSANDLTALNSADSVARSGDCRYGRHVSLLR